MTEEARSCKWNYLKIPGFGCYQIEPGTKEVWSCRWNRWHLMKPKTLYYRLTADDDGQKYGFMPNRLLFAALRGIDPRKIGGELRVVERDGKLELTDIAGQNKLALTNWSDRRFKDVEGGYRRIIRMCELVLHAYETDDWVPVLEELRRHEGRMRTYLTVHRLAADRRRQDELLAQTFDLVLCRMRDRRTFVYNAEPYLIKVLRGVHAQDSRRRRMTRRLDEGRMGGNCEKKREKRIQNAGEMNHETTVCGKRQEDR